MASFMHQTTTGDALERNSSAQLLEYFQLRGTALRLSGIFRGRALFTSRMKYPLNARVKAAYVAEVPLDDPLLHSETPVEFISRDRAVPYVRFKFDRYENNHGDGV